MKTMKTIKTLALLSLLLITVSSCDLPFGGSTTMSFYRYELALNFQNASGDDLVKGIELGDVLGGTVRSDLYVLDIILYEPCENWDNDIYNTPARPGYTPDVHRPTLQVKEGDNGYSYLANEFFVPINGCPEEKILTYKLTCPYLFGDEEIHELVTYWNVPEKREWHGVYAKCYLIEYEGKAITPVRMDEVNDGDENYAATITLGE
jgi:hypothetical protein